MRRLTVIIAVMVLLTSCSSLQLLNMGIKRETEAMQYYYDMETKIEYSINRDDENIYLTLKTDDENTIRSMFRKGLYVYFDPNGRKSKHIFFHYPISAEMGPGMMPRGQMPMRQMSENGQQAGNFTPPAFDVHTLIDAAEMEAIFSYKDLAEKLPVYSQRTDIAVTLTSPKQGSLIYELRMPVSRLEKDDISELTIGIISGDIDMPSMSGGPGGGPGGGGMPQGGGGMPSGGMQSARPGGGGPGGAPNDRPDGQSKGMNLQDINIWFKVNLIEQNN